MIAVGVDTHKHEHLARALDGLGQLLGGLEIKTNLAGYLELADWLRAFGDEVVVGIEGAGSYGAHAQFATARPSSRDSRSPARRLRRPCDVASGGRPKRKLVR